MSDIRSNRCSVFVRAVFKTARGQDETKDIIRQTQIKAELETSWKN